MNGSEYAAAGAILGGLLGSMLLFAFVFVVLLIIARWKVFTKAGEKGWKSIIPIYSDYVQWRIGWKQTGFFWIYLALVIIGSILMSMGGVTTAQLMGSAPITANTVGNSGMVIAGSIAAIVGYVVYLVSVYKLFQSFGHGVGWFILYIFFPNIMLLVLGFGSSQWQGAMD